MRYQVLGYDVVKNGEWTILHLIDLQSRCNMGYKPLVVTKNGKTFEGLWVGKNIQFNITKDILNKVINVEFSPSGGLTKIELEK